MMIEPITTKFDEKAKDDPTKKVKTILGKSDPNQVRHKVFVDTDPRVWDVVYLQLANAGVSQETINEVYDDVRGGTPHLDPNPLALHLLARYKLTELNSSDDATAALETLSDIMVNSPTTHPLKPWRTRILMPSRPWASFPYLLPPFPRQSKPRTPMTRTD